MLLGVAATVAAAELVSPSPVPCAAVAAGDDQAANRRQRAGACVIDDHVVVGQVDFGLLPIVSEPARRIWFPRLAASDTADVFSTSMTPLIVSPP